MSMRRTNGKQIQQMGHVTKIHKRHYCVESQSQKNNVRITKNDVISYTCKDHKFKKSRCKHIHAVEFYMGFGAEYGDKFVPKSDHKTTIEVSNVDCCPIHGADPVIMKGVRRNNYHNVQIYYCKKCKRKFSGNLGFERLKASPKIVTVAINMYFNGESFLDVADTLSLLGIDVTPETVENWITTSIAKICTFDSTLHPKLSEDWRADEMYIAFDGKMAYVYSMMDDHTRYWITSHIADEKETPDICSMFQDASCIAGENPETLVTDGAPNFHAAWEKEYKAKNQRQKKTQHIHHIHLNGVHNNNLMERLNCEIVKK